ncbi:MAG: hypothetical protein KDC95_10515 [Planctomycetes bacterium]|nr:hypothetical protein [Planctomycetota bacterium]
MSRQIEDPTRGGVPRTGTEFLGLRLSDVTEFGAHGTSFLAVDTKAHEVRVFKVLEEGVQSWFESHAPLLRRGELRGMARLLSTATAPIPHAVFEPLHGTSLEALASGIGAFKARSALRAILEVTGILAGPGSAGLFHPGLCAQNVFFGADGRITVLDWGLPGAPSGYRAPELDDGRSTVASEIYAIGAMLFRLLTGFEPHRPRTADESFDQLGKLLQAGHSPKVITVLERCLSFDKGARFACHSELLFVIGRMLHEAIEDAPDELGDVDAVSGAGGVRAEIEKQLDWLDEDDGGFPTDERDRERKRAAKKARQGNEPTEVSTEATASALDAMRAELVQSFRKGTRGARNKEDGA